jgi:hypothetical protein
MIDQRLKYFRDTWVLNTSIKFSIRIGSCAALSIEEMAIGLELSTHDESVPPSRSLYDFWPSLNNPRLCASLNQT